MQKNPQSYDFSLRIVLKAQCSGLEFVRADFRPERTGFRPKKANFRPEKADSRPERAWGG